MLQNLLAFFALLEKMGRNVKFLAHSWRRPSLAATVLQPGAVITDEDNVRALIVFELQSISNWSMRTSPSTRSTQSTRSTVDKAKLIDKARTVDKTITIMC